MRVNNNGPRTSLQVAQNHWAAARASDIRPPWIELFRRQVLRSPQDRRQAVRLRRAVQRAGRSSSEEILDRHRRPTSTAIFSEDCAIDYLEQTPIEKLNPHNILDAEGIKQDHRPHRSLSTCFRTNEFENDEKKKITKQNVEAAEAIYELERQQADAKAKQTREIESVKAREQAETLKIQAEEKLKAETARIKSDEDIAVQEENLKRQVEVAAKNRERVVAVETERVEKERMLEVISRDRETELQTIAKDKEVEVEKRNIANVIRERVAVDKTVAEEEEAIKRLRMVEEANRTKEATIITAEAQAQEQLVKDIKAAEAAEAAAKHKAAASS